MLLNAALQTATVAEVIMATHRANKDKVGLTVFNVPRALLTKLHKGFKVLVLIVVMSKLKIVTNTHN